MLRDVSIGRTPETTSRTLFDEGIGAEAPSPSWALAAEDDEIIPDSEPGAEIKASAGILFDARVTTMLPEDELEFVPDSEPDRIEALARVISAEAPNESQTLESEEESVLVPDSEPAKIQALAGNFFDPRVRAEAPKASQMLSEDEFVLVPNSSDPFDSRSQTQPSNPQQSPPQPLPSPSPHPQTAFHVYAGAFPSQEMAMINGYYTDSISVTVVEDPRAADYRMVKSDGIPRSWMKGFQASNPQQMFEEKVGKQHTCWEWVSHL